MRYALGAIGLAVGFFWAVPLAFGELSWAHIIIGIVTAVFSFAMLLALGYLRRRLYPHEFEPDPRSVTPTTEEHVSREFPVYWPLPSAAHYAVWIFVMLFVIFLVAAILSGELWLVAVGVVLGAWSGFLYWRVHGGGTPTGQR
jgi:hypothetical protein